MSVRHCEFEIIPPDGAQPGPAPQHPDPAVQVELALEGRTWRPRRFAFATAIPQPDGGVRVSVPYLGFQQFDGTVLITMSGKPYGWYVSVDSAYAHMPGNTEHLYLVWLEPPLPSQPETTAARRESWDTEPQPWLVAVPFLAHGPADARLHAITLADVANESLPGIFREGLLLINGENPAAGAVALFCPEPGCYGLPFHDGEHQPPTVTDAIYGGGLCEPEPEPVPEGEPETGAESAEEAS